MPDSKPDAPAPPRAQLVSAPFGCGVAWLVNVLLELDVRTTHYGLQQDHWLDTEEGEQIGPEALGHLRWHLPSLAERQCFQFPEYLEVLWEHRLSFARSSTRKTILYVRDPRDAVYSLYRRNYAELFSLEEYLARPDVWPDHFPLLFGLPPADTIALFNLFWLSLGDALPLHVMRFEDMRAEPVAEVQRCLAFLGLERSDAQIERALGLSSFDRAKSAMEQLESETGTQFRTARRGKVDEWKEAYTAEQLASFRGLSEVACAELGYAALPEGVPPLVKPIWNQAELLERVLPETRMALNAACQRFEEGNASEAERVLLGAAARCPDHLVSRLALAGVLVALRWTETVFSPLRRRSAPAKVAFYHWAMIAHCFAEQMDMQRLLVGALDFQNPEAPEAALRPLAKPAGVGAGA